MSIEAMKQAIDALNEAVAFREGGRQKAIDAITALRTAIQQATQPTEVTDRDIERVFADHGLVATKRSMRAARAILALLTAGQAQKGGECLPIRGNQVTCSRGTGGCGIQHKGGD